MQQISKKWLIIIIVVLALMVINTHKPFGFHYYKHTYIDKIPRQISEKDELYTLKLYFSVNLENSDLKLEEVFVKDSLNDQFLLNTIFKNGHEKLLVCRYSEMHCESCVNFAIHVMLSQINSMGKDNVLFLGMHRNNRIFNQEKKHYNLQDMNVYNTSTLNIPVEKLINPYYFILNKDMTISNVFVPDKATPNIAEDYLKMISKRFF